MKYKQILDQNMVPEWRNKYLDYKGLDAALNKAIDSKLRKSREKGVDSYFELIKFNQKFANYFSHVCEEELEKINQFHHDKVNEMKGIYSNLKDQLEQVLSSAIYRQIQPSLEPKKFNLNNGLPQSRRNSMVSDSLSSITDIFKGIKGRVSPNQSLNQLNGQDGSTANGPTFQNQNSLHPFSKIMKTRRDSLCSLFADNSEASSQASRERLSRRLSDTASLSVQKISNQVSKLVTGLQPASPQPSIKITPIKVDRSFQLSKEALVIDGMVPSIEVENDLNSMGDDDSNSVDEKPNRLKSLLRRTSHSKKKIVATYKRKMDSLKFSFRELYVSLVLLEQYTQLNYTGFEQILRKHDRMFASSLGRKFYQEHVQMAEFHSNQHVVDDLIENVEHIYTLHFENGNRRRAIKKLQLPPNVYKRVSRIQDFRVGYELGMFVILFICALLVGIYSETGFDWRTVFRLYRSPLLLTIFLFQMGISIIIWKHYKINHVLIFELNPRDNLSANHFLELGSMLGIIWSISVIVFLFSDQLDIPPSLCPLVVVLIIIGYLFNPTATCHHQSRFWLLRILVRFADFWVADQLVSIVPLFLDLEYLSCFYTTGDVMSKNYLSLDYASRCVTRNPQDLIIRTIVAAFPAWIRCAQCLRRWRDEGWPTIHIANAGKYFGMVSVVVLSSISQYNKKTFELDTMRIVWIIAATFISALTAFWDLKYDFGFFNTFDTEKDDEKSNTKENLTNRESINSADGFYYNSKKKKERKRWPLLRNELVYPVWIYYFAIVEDIILRFGWIITMSLTEFSGIEAGLVVSLLAPMEMFRRFVWNSIRLENEQLNNCGMFRAVRDIPIEVAAPIDESNLDRVIMMMDSRDGPAMRNRLVKKRAVRPDRVSFVLLERPDESTESLSSNSESRI